MPLSSTSRPVVRGIGVAAAAALCATMAPTLGAAASTSSALEFDSPSGLAVGGGHLWVTNAAGNSVSEINPATGAWITTLHANADRFNRPSAITTFDADLFVANGSDTVTQLKDSNGALIRVVAGRKFHFINPVAIAGAGGNIFVLNAGPSGGAGSITVFNAHRGTFVRRVAGPSFAFNNPVAFTISGADIFVADEGNNSVTEVNRSTGALVRVVSQQGLDAPDGVAVQDGNVWVADSASNAATEITMATGTVVATDSDADGAYGFGSPSVAVGVGGNVYIASPFGDSPMVTKMSATTGVPSWFMCNNNGPYYFSQLSAFAVSGSNLWVASQSGANSMTPGASTGSLTELSLDTGALVTTLPTS